jgi:hypothetical protein
MSNWRKFIGLVIGLLSIMFAVSLVVFCRKLCHYYTARHVLFTIITKVAKTSNCVYGNVSNSASTQGVLQQKSEGLNHS